MPLKTINLGHWEFVTFVRRTQRVEQEIYDYETENNSDIMMLIRRGSNIRLVSIKVNPWISYGETCQRPNKEYELQMFMFSGLIQGRKDIRGDRI
jgi:hypothetical protein